MRIDLLHSFSWEESGEAGAAALPEHLKLTGGQSVRVYNGLSQALFEIAFGTAHLFSHKRNMGLVSGNTWAFDAIMPLLYKENFQVQEVSWQTADFKTFLADLKKETLFVLWSEDHPITGELAEADQIDQELNSRRIFSIRVSHFAHLTRGQELRPYSIRLCSLSQGLTLALCGARFRTGPVIAHRQNWSVSDIVEQIQSRYGNAHEDESAVLNFEKETPLASGFFPLLQHHRRIFDRAIIYHPNLNSEPVMHSLLGKQALSRQGEAADVEILNRCRWQPLPQLRAWWKPMPDEAVLRGLLLLSVNQIKTTGVMEALKAGERAASVVLP